ncbi:MAG: hypothetical protein LUG52_05590 [Clostridia bacterium]|nr:hypothetical protein [Clostridia bacterium]
MAVKKPKEGKSMIISMKMNGIVLSFEETESVREDFGKTTLDEQVYNVGGKQFKGDEPTRGELKEVLFEGYEHHMAIKEDKFGDRVIYEYVAVPTFDSGDSMWDSYRKYALVFDGESIDLVLFKGGYRIARIEIYTKLISAGADFKKYAEKLNYPKEVWDNINWIED